MAGKENVRRAQNFSRPDLHLLKQEIVPFVCSFINLSSSTWASKSLLLLLLLLQNNLIYLPRQKLLVVCEEVLKMESAKKENVPQRKSCNE